MQNQFIEPPLRGFLVVAVHLDGLERANLDANLALHADADVDVEHLRSHQWFTLLVAVHHDVDALRRTLDLANLARRAPRLVRGFVIDQKRKRARVLRGLDAFLRVLDRNHPFLGIETPDVILGRHDQALDQTFAGEVHYRSTSPNTMSMLPNIMTASATFCPTHMSSSTVKLIKLGGRT